MFSKYYIVIISLFKATVKSHWKYRNSHAKNEHQVINGEYQLNSFENVSGVILCGK